MASESMDPLVRCANHMFNLAVETWISSKPDLRCILDTLSELMIQLGTLNNAAKLMSLTHLGAIKANITR